MSTKFLIASDIHYGSINSGHKMDDFYIEPDFDCALLAGDVGVYDQEISYILNTYFKDKKVCFLGGNHMTYLNPTEEIHSIINRHKKDYPLDSDWSFLENDYKIINDVIIIGCNLYTNYKLKCGVLRKRTVNKNDEPTDINGRVLIKDPRESEEFLVKRQQIMEAYFDHTIDGPDTVLKDLYNSVSPALNEFDSHFKARVSEEVYNRWHAYEEDQKNQGYKEYTLEEYKRWNQNIAYRCMNDFRYGRIFDSKSLLGIRNLEPKDYEKWHKESLKYIDKIYKQFENTDYKIIVMTHHCPTAKLMGRQWKNSDINASYYSNLESFIKKHSKIKHWICGHIHDRKEVQIGQCRVIANPYGYQVLGETEGFKPVIIEL